MNDTEDLAGDPDDDDYHCQHTVRTNTLEDWDTDDDFCVHCECCCTCLGCEYGPRDGMLMFPNGAFGAPAAGAAPAAGR